MRPCGAHRIPRQRAPSTSQPADCLLKAPPQLQELKSKRKIRGTRAQDVLYPCSLAMEFKLQSGEPRGGGTSCWDLACPPGCPIGQLP